MTFLKTSLKKNLQTNLQTLGQRFWVRALLSLVLGLSCLLLNATPAFAGLTDDRFDGNIFPLYAGNGSLVPPRVTLAEALRQDRPILLTFYVDDSSDCKKYVSVISQLDASYGRAANFIPISADTIPRKASYDPSEPGYYYKGYVPQTLILDAKGKVILDAKGSVPFEQIDDEFRKVFDLLPRSESVELKRRQVNEVNTELVN
ncbi:MAG: thylakoid membrane photosystem I accumulation factor [Oculatellaceae cyanobacterium Prado106]|jgi:hypothetical protein|nr:thylakoid membrane photosystem I accumulation factor [Oculatellaceae cyanobacterium Prado106]